MHMKRRLCAAPMRADLIADCQHMATSAMGIAADLARLAEQECAGIRASENARHFIRQRLNALAEQAEQRL